MNRTIKASSKDSHGKQRAVSLDEAGLRAMEVAARKLARPSATSRGFEDLEAKTEAARKQMRRG
jgi:hypothetical protein